MPQCVPSETFQIGTSRPPLLIGDLPTPEQVFGVRRIGLEELILLVLGPGIVGAGTAIASGEWLLGPLAVGQAGFHGVGWVILVSAILQTFYNVELARFTLATGESPIIAFGRVPPGKLLWVPLALLCLYMAFILGGWTSVAGASLFALFAGRAHTGSEIEIVRVLGIALLALDFVFLLFGRRVGRTMEILHGVFLTFILIGLVVVTLVVVPFQYWGRASLSLVLPVMPQHGTDAALLGALAGFTALAAGLNFMFVGLYRDKGFGMGYQSGHLSGLVGGDQVEIVPVGRTFRKDEKNAECWKRWFRYVLVDQWGVFFIACMVGMMTPCILVGYLASTSTVKPSQASIAVFAATELGRRYGPLLFGWALVTGFLILCKAQVGFLDALARNFVEGMNAISGTFRRHFGHDPRRFYYPYLLLLVAVIGCLIHLAQPMQFIMISANTSNLSALIFPLALIYLNRRLPAPARIKWWSYLVLVANTVFFGFFFLNFVMTQFYGRPWLRF